MRICAVLLTLCLLVGCAASRPTSSTFIAYPDGSTTDTPNTGPSAGQIIGTILLLPLLIPLAAIASNQHGYGGYSCKGKIYADGTKWRSSCY
jgi:hypothetical protein